MLSDPALFRGTANATTAASAAITPIPIITFLFFVMKFFRFIRFLRFCWYFFSKIAGTYTEMMKKASEALHIACF
jgi:hypothetical protein